MSRSKFNLKHFFLPFLIMPWHEFSHILLNSVTNGIRSMNEKTKTFSDFLSISIFVRQTFFSWNVEKNNFNSFIFIFKDIFLPSRDSKVFFAEKEIYKLFKANIFLPYGARLITIVARTESFPGVPLSGFICNCIRFWNEKRTAELQFSDHF